MSDFAPSNEVDDLLASLPGFVKRVPIPDATELGFHWWSPDRTGDSAMDHTAGAAYFNAALAFCDRVNNSGLLMFATNAMQGGVIDHVECGFVEALASKAMVGALPDFATDEELDIAIIGNPDLVKQFRDNEATAVLARELCRIEKSPVSLCFFLGQCFLGKRGHLIGGATRLLAVAACNGAKH